MTASTVTTLSDQQLDALITRVSDASEHGLALSPEDTQLLLNALLMLANVQSQLTDKHITLTKLRKLVGMVQSSERLNHVLGTAAGPSKPKRSTRQKTTVPPVKPRVEHHPHNTLSKGEACPECDQGKLAKTPPATLLRITGQPAFTPVQHLSERLRCNTCGAYFTAPLPEDVLADGDANQKYGHSARSVMALHKYFAGAPFYRQGSLQQLLGVSISASTVYDQCEALANALHPIFKTIKRLAADADHYHLDDTTHRILKQQPIEKKRPNSDKLHTRTGVYSSGLIAQCRDGQELILYNTDIGHAGEWLDDILLPRLASADPPIVMSDALSSNHTTDKPIIKTLCNAHARRQFVDVFSHFPDEVGWVLEQYKRIWQHEDETREQQMTPEQRRDYHRAHSLPVMESIRVWGHEQLNNHHVETNSGLGKAIRYFDNHFDGLSGFCQHPSAQLDNNRMEQQLKLIVRNRKNAGFYKTAIGAHVGDIITSLIATCAQAGINAFEYFNAIQRDNERVKQTPEDWLPWCYEKTLKEKP